MAGIAIDFVAVDDVDDGDATFAPGVEDNEEGGGFVTEVDVVVCVGVATVALVLFVATDGFVVAPLDDVGVTAPVVVTFVAGAVVTATAGNTAPLTIPNILVTKAADDFIRNDRRSFVIVSSVLRSALVSETDDLYPTNNAVFDEDNDGCDRTTEKAYALLLIVENTTTNAVMTPC